MTCFAAACAPSAGAPAAAAPSPSPFLLFLLPLFLLCAERSGVRADAGAASEAGHEREGLEAFRCSRASTLDEGMYIDADV